MIPNSLPIPYRTTAEIRAQLADLAKRKAQATASGTSDFASRIGMQSILKHEQELLEELTAAEQFESNGKKTHLSNGIKACEERKKA